ncbi:hypothetical protein Tco_0431931 [Tanacetum coccineum]
MEPLPPREQRHLFLRYQGLEYIDKDIADFEERMRMEHHDDAGVVGFTSQAWGKLFGTKGLLVWELILEFLSTLRFGEVLLDLDAPGTIQFQLGRGQEMIELEAVYFALGITHRGGDGISWDLPFLRFDQRWHTVLLGGFRHLKRRFAAERKSGAHISGGQFMARLAEHFGLLTVEILGGLMVITPELPIIDMAELVRLHICAQFDDTWDWVAMGPEKQPDVAVGAPAISEDAPAVDEGDQAVPTPVQAPQQPPLPPAAARTIPQRLGRLEEDVQGLRRDVGSLRGLWRYQ